MPRPGATAARLAPSEARRPARDRGAEARRAGLSAAVGAGAATMETGGDLTKERRKVLQDLSTLLNVSVDRHKAEVRRAVNDELLHTIATT